MRGLIQIQESHTTSNHTDGNHTYQHSRAHSNQMQIDITCKYRAPIQNKKRFNPTLLESPLAFIHHLKLPNQRSTRSA